MTRAQRAFWWVCIILVVLWRVVQASAASNTAHTCQVYWDDKNFSTWGVSIVFGMDPGTGKPTAYLQQRDLGCSFVPYVRLQSAGGGDITTLHAWGTGSAVTLEWNTSYKWDTFIITGGVAYWPTFDGANGWTFETGKPSTQWTTTLKNTTGAKITYYFNDKVTGKLVGSVELEPGEMWAGTIKNPEGNGVTVTGAVTGYQMVNGELVPAEDPNAVYAYALGELTPGAGTGYVAGQDQTKLPVDVSVTTTEGGVLLSNDSGGVTSGKPIFVGSSAVNSTTTATNGVLAQGFNGLAEAQGAAADKIVAAIKANKTTGGGGSSGGSTTVNVDMSGVTSRLDLVKSKLDEISARDQVRKEAADARKAREDELIAANPTQAAMQSQGAAAGAAAADIINGKGGAAPSALGFDPSGNAGDYASALQFTMPVAFGGATFDFNPFSRPGLLSVAHWFREATRWLALVTLGIWAWVQMADWVRGLSTIRQATGNAVAAGTGAQATALIAAGLMTVAIVVASTALMAWTFGGIGFGALRDASGLNPLVGMSSAVVGFLGEIFPIATLLSCLVARFTFNFYASAIFSTCAAVVRFIVP